METIPYLGHTLHRWRVGQSTFALRGAEAACIQVEGAGGRAA